MSVKPLPKRNPLVVHTEIDRSAMVFLAVSAGSNKRSVSLDVNVMTRLEVPSKHPVSSAAAQAFKGPTVWRSLAMIHA